MVMKSDFIDGIPHDIIRMENIEKIEFCKQTLTALTAHIATVKIRPHRAAEEIPARIITSASVSAGGIKTYHTLAWSSSK
jgi:hypothetical protein